jgi:hypothetical protein
MTGLPKPRWAQQELAAEQPEKLSRPGYDLSNQLRMLPKGRDLGHASFD